MSTLTKNQLYLLSECENYALMIDRSRAGKSRWYRLGGHGYVPLRYDARTMRALVDLGLVDEMRHFQATEKGKAVLAKITP